MNKVSHDSRLLEEIESGSVVCPKCRSALTSLDSRTVLVCGKCGREYQLKDNIPLFADVSLLDSFKSTESAFHSDIAAEACDAHGFSSLRVQSLHKTILKPILSATSEGSKILEVAVGPGYDMVQLLEQGRRVFGIDIAQAMCSEAMIRTSNPTLRDHRILVQGDAEALPFPDAHFEGVVCVASLHHFPHPREALREINRVLKPGGIASIGSEPNSWPYRFKRLKHSGIGKRILRLFRNDYTVEGGSIADFETSGFEETELRRMAETAGFVVNEITPNWYTAGFLSLFALRLPDVLESASLRIDALIANMQWARRFCWKWNLVLCKSAR